jgi:hypothetical protein
MFLTACDDDFILKCEWIHISGGSMRNAYLSKTKVQHNTQHVPHIIMCTQKKKLFEFLKYNNICSILNESISKLCGLSTKYAHIWGTVKITHCLMHSSTESFNEWRFTNQNTLKKYSQKKNSLCMEINRV